MEKIEEFEQDLINEIKGAYDEAGILYNSNDSFKSFLISYITLLLRIVGPRKRKVHISKEINSIISKSDDESKRLKILVNLMKEKFENGEDVNGFLSKTILNIYEDDMLFDDWFIKHFHMSLDDMDFFDRSRVMTSDLLFAIVLRDDVYFLQITNHGRNDFVDSDYLRIMKNNWENELLIKHDNIMSMEFNVEDVENIKTFRKIGMNSIIHKIDNNYYSVKYTLGYSMGNKSISAQNKYFRIINEIEELDLVYDHLIFKKYTIGTIATIYDKKDNYFEIGFDAYSPI